MTQADQLHQGIEVLGLALPSGVESLLLSYLSLLTKWNRTYNLTAVRDEAEIVTHHLLDSLTLVPFLTDTSTLADVGSGAGLPAIPLAIACPKIQIVSFETVQKKAAFQQQARIELRLDNLSVRCARVERERGVFEVVTSRAFASLTDFVGLAGHLVRDGGRMLAMKGVYPADEIADLPPGWCVGNAIELKVPGLDARRHLIVLQRKA